MATSYSGVEKYDFCNGYVSLVVEWSVKQDLLNGTNTYTANLYLDTTKCYMVRHSSTGHNYISSFAFGDAGEVTFYFPENLKVEKRLIASVSGTKAVGEADIKAGISFTCWFNGTIKAYSSLTANFESANSARFSKSITIPGITRTTVGTVYGEHILGVENTLVLNRVREEFSHIVYYSCADMKDDISLETTNEEIKFTLPVELAKYDIDDPTVDIVFHVKTIYNGTEIGTKMFYVSYLIPPEVKPSCTVKVTDGSFRDGQPLTDIYGGYVQRQSRFNIVVTPTTVYNSPIVSYNIKANGSEYDTAEAVTGLIKTSGTNEIIVTVTDQRGRTSEAVIQTFDVIPYAVPIVSKIKVNRCNADGVEQSNSKLNTHIKVTFDAAISAVNNINSASYMLTYQKVSGLSQVDVMLTDYVGRYSVTDGVYIFEADKDSPYEITVKATDDFATGSRATGGSSAMTIFNILASGLGLCFGGNATLDNVIENMLLTYPSGGFMFPALAAGSDLINTRIPNVYTVESGQDVGHSPTDEGYTLIVLPGAGTGDFVYIAITGNGLLYINTLTDSSWGSWSLK